MSRASRRAYSCRKIRYRDRIAAELVLASLVRRDRTNRATTERRSYQCPDCHGWHLTSWARP